MNRLLMVLLFVLMSITMSRHLPVQQQTVTRPAIDISKTREKAKEALEFCIENRLNTRYCLLGHMGIHSGVKRLMLWDFQKDTIRFAGLVSHGCGEHPWGADASKDMPVFKNVPQSYCSSLGKYKTGERGYSNWGIHVKYLLHGLEPTNDNALARQIVFHSWDLVPDGDVFPEGTPEGWGCPAVSNHFMQETDRLIKDETKPVLLWLYN